MIDPRFVVVGAGAIGGTLAVGLHEAGLAVEVVARGAHLDTIRSSGLRRRAPDGDHNARITAHAGVDELEITDETVVVMATKVHQAEVVLDELLAAHGPDLTIACAHNGVDGERLALRRFRHVYGVVVNVPGVHLTPGIVEVYATVPRGVLDVGVYPEGNDDTSAAIATAFTRAGFSSESTPTIMARKWAKLLGNVGNALQVLCGPERECFDQLAAVVHDEAERVVTAAGIEVDRSTQQARAAAVARAPIAGTERPGGSTWQSAHRGTGDIETTALNGEICLLGRQIGVPTPANDLVQSTTLALLANGDPIGTYDQHDLIARLERT